MHPADRGGQVDRLAAIEQGVQARLNELSRSWTGLADRMNSIEETLHETSRLAAQSAALPPPRVDLAPLNDRLAQLERAVRDGLGDSRGVETFFDGKVFDPADPSAYLKSLAIKRGVA